LNDTDVCRNDAPNGLLLSVRHLKGIQVSSDVEVRGDGFEPVVTEDSIAANVLQSQPRERYVVSIGAGVTTQELVDALGPSGLVSIAAGHGNITVAGGWVSGPSLDSYLTLLASKWWSWTIFA
jgi:FAD/FMN-containing dehydrogenase